MFSERVLFSYLVHFRSFLGPDRNALGTSTSMIGPALLILACLVDSSSAVETVKLGRTLVISWRTVEGSSSILSVGNVDTGIPLWASYESIPFLQLGDASVPRPPILDGNYQLLEETSYLTNKVVIDAVQKGPDFSVLVQGSLFSTAYRNQPIAHYEMTFVADENSQVQFTVNITPDPAMIATVANPRLFLTYRCEKNENFYGFGESFSFFNLKGKNVPILVSEQGVGRGEQPITDTLNADVAEGVGGSWHTTYAPKPIYTTNYNRTFMLNNSEVSFFNLTHTAGEEVLRSFHDIVTIRSSLILSHADSRAIF
jgi:hypothetical protein